MYSVDRFRWVFDMYEINPYFHQDLTTLERFEIVVLCDDSGSMNTRVDGTAKTRWDELKEVVQMVIDLGGVLDQTGIDIMFLNRPGMDNVRQFSQVEHLFRNRPSGSTPLGERLQEASRKKGPFKPMLLIVATDGVPDNMKNFKKFLKHRDPNIYISILACSDKERDVGYLNKLDKKIPNLDVLDDYRSERKEVLKKQGKHFPYSFGDHVARMLLGPVYQKYDQLDEHGYK